MFHPIVTAIVLSQFALLFAQGSTAKNPPVLERHEMTSKQEHDLCFVIDDSNRAECDPFGDIANGNIDAAE